MAHPLLVAKAKRRAAAEIQDGETEGGARPIRMRPFRRKNGRLYVWPSTEGVLDLCNGAVSEKTPQTF